MQIYFMHLIRVIDIVDLRVLTNGTAKFKEE